MSSGASDLPRLPAVRAAAVAGAELHANDVLWGGLHARGRIRLIHNPGDPDGLLVAWVTVHLKGGEHGVSRQDEITFDPAGIYFVVPPQSHRIL
jgi:hypothetical protein